MKFGRNFADNLENVEIFRNSFFFFFFFSRDGLRGNRRKDQTPTGDAWPWKWIVAITTMRHSPENRKERTVRTMGTWCTRHSRQTNKNWNTIQINDPKEKKKIVTGRYVMYSVCRLRRRCSKCSCQKQKSFRIFWQNFAKFRYFWILFTDFCSDFDEILSDFRR